MMNGDDESGVEGMKELVDREDVQRDVLTEQDRIKWSVGRVKESLIQKHVLKGTND